MTPTAAARIESDVIRRITSRLGSGSPAREEAVQAVDYDWRQCHHYGPDALAKIKELAEKAVGTIVEKLAELLHAQPEMAVESVEQLFARELAEGGSETSSWMVHFKSPKGKTCGYLGLSGEAATRLVAFLLGDDNSKKEPSATLSELEETLLMGIASAVGQSFAKSVTAGGGAAIVAAGQFEKSGGHQLDTFADVCKTTLGTKVGELACKMEVVLLCEVLDPAVGMEIKTAAESPEKTRSMMLECMKPSALAIDTLVGQASISIKDLAELKPGDVIVLEKTVGEPVDVFMNGKALCQGQLAAYEGQYAVVAERILRVAAKK